MKLLQRPAAPVRRHSQKIPFSKSFSLCLMSNKDRVSLSSFRGLVPGPLQIPNPGMPKSLMKNVIVFVYNSHTSSWILYIISKSLLIADTM
jgi:hypothetical protein